jgi:hypothetical protein
MVSDMTLCRIHLFLSERELRINVFHHICPEQRDYAQAHRTTAARPIYHTTRFFGALLRLTIAHWWLRCKHASQ